MLGFNGDSQAFSAHQINTDNALEQFSHPCSVAAVAEVVGAFLGCEAIDEAPESVPESVLNRHFSFPVSISTA